MQHEAAAFKGLNPSRSRLNVKPVFIFLVHHNDAEGPCRVGTSEQLDPASERARLAAAQEAALKALERLDPTVCNLLEPVLIEHGDDWLVKASEYAKLDADSDQVDVYLVQGLSLNQFFAVKLGERYRKPVILVGEPTDAHLPMGVDAASHLRYKGLEAWVPVDFDELNALLAALRVRKALHQTRLLRVTLDQFDNVNGNFADLHHFRDKLGLDYVDVPLKAFVDELDAVREDSETCNLAEKVAAELVEGAQAVHIDRPFVTNDVLFYLAAKGLMERYGCNAFTINCFEICPDGRAAAQRQVTPCLTHSLLKDQGLASGCEGDVGVLTALNLLQNVASRTAPMGNLYLVDKQANVMKILHDVPGLKVLGYSAPDVPYALRHFTVGGWGTTVRYDYSLQAGQPVTLSRVNPAGDAFLVAHGTVVGVAGFDSVGCSLEAHIQLPDVVDFFHKAADFGNHTAFVFGDWRPQLRLVAEVMGLKMVETA